MAQFTDALAEMSDATTEVGNKIDKLLDLIENGGATEQEEQDAIAQIRANTARLKAMAPENAAGADGSPVPQS